MLAAVVASSIATIVMTTLATPAAAQSAREKAITSCLIGQASEALLKIRKDGASIDADEATDRATRIASSKCPKGQISEAGGDYVYHSVRALARQIFPEAE
jgi:hypothetical protein